RIYRRQSRPSLPRRFTATKAQRPALLRCVTIRIAAAFVQLRGLVQHVLSTLRPSGIISELDCFPVKPFRNLTLIGNRRDMKNLTLGKMVFSNVDGDGKVLR